jgi:lipopolysaccharide transport system ATP-binding protein
VVFDGVWKKFRTGEAHDSLRDLLPALLRRVGPRQRLALAEREFWAVRDVSFRVDPGEVFGIIGANGAGKSTVLKLLTRILRPTQGRIDATGRIGALIEVSAGFHPDLTGRENVFLQGAILGMPTREVTNKFDTIVEFAGVADFIDTPVKRYSSGMNARLGFAIAAHLEPDVLVTDEVLSVGDFMFQQRAFGRLTEIAESGVPVIVVSHQLDRVAALCTRAIVLDRGAIVHQGTAAACVAWYTGATRAGADPTAQGPVRLLSLELRESAARSGERVTFRVTGETRTRDGLATTVPVGLRFRSIATGELVSRTNSIRCGVPSPDVGPFTLEGDLQLNVPPGVYMIEVQPYDLRQDRAMQQSLTASVTVLDGPDFLGRVQLNVRMQLVPGGR